MSTLSYHFPEFAIGALVTSKRSAKPWNRPALGVRSKREAFPCPATAAVHCLRSSGPSRLGRTATVTIRSGRDGADDGIGWVELDGRLTDIMARVRTLAVHRIRPTVVPLSNCETAGSGRARSVRTLNRHWLRRDPHGPTKRLHRLRDF